MTSEDKLSIWASAPSETEMIKIKNTKDYIEKVLKDYLDINEIKRKYNLSSFTYEVYLQGSYKNSTNIRYDSDVDIVVQVNSVFWSDKSELSPDEIDRYNKAYSNTSYGFLELKEEIYNVLKGYFGEDVAYKNKCIKVNGNTNRVDADVVPCFQYRVYKKFISVDNCHFVEGIKFLNTNDNTEIINFPKVHYENGCSKNDDTDGKYKSMVRVFKNIKRDMVEKGLIDDNIAPSYFIENLIYNCTSHCFDGNYSESTLKIFQFLLDSIKQDRLKSFLCVNEQDMLFSNKTWNLADAIRFINDAGDYFLNS
nr:nucleotidyltransferase [Candidatus Gracilibacteria bacterium]